MTDTPEIAGLCEMLRETRSVWSEAKEVSIKRRRNPDGTKAADTLERQAAEIERISSENATLTDEIDKIADQAFAADDRATKAAAEIERLRGALKRIANKDNEFDRETHLSAEAALTGEDR
jgi:ketosteroid isomerase-like protein